MIEITDKETFEAKKIPTMKLYRVFNLDQTTITAASIPEIELVKATTAEKIRENFLDKPEVVQHPQPHYSPQLDRIGIPHRSNFDSIAAYWVTLFHEGVHSTGAEKRIGRKEVMKSNMSFGDGDYSQEELVAEL